MPRHVVVFLSLLVALCVSGCNGQSSPPASIDGGQEDDYLAAPSTEEPETFPNTMAVDAEYYTSGPQQGRAPDGTLTAGTKVNVLRRTGGYSLVRTADGVEGYVASDSIQDPTAGALE